MSYCQAGDTARVTFPDDSVQDFTDTPINIECQEVRGDECESIYFIINITYRTSSNTSTNTFRSRINNTNRNVRAPYFGELRIRTTTGDPPLSNRVEADVNGLSSCNGRQWVDVLHRNFWVEIFSINWYTVHRLLDDEELEPKFRITITGSEGAELFSDTFDNCNYSVECIENCPPNTLDCGDCCLPCDSVFNSISNLRARVATLK